MDKIYCAMVFFLFGFAHSPVFAVEHFRSERDARQHCPNDTVVWLNLRSGSILRKGQSWYGRTHIGAFACLGELDRSGRKVKPGSYNNMAGWTKIAEDKDRSVYARSSPVWKSGAKVTTLSMIDLRKAASLSDGKRFLSWETQYEFDCKEKQSRVIAASMYSGNMGGGEVTNSVEYESPDWEAIQPGSNGEVLWNRACRKNRPAP